ncbi:hypothetical protein [Thermopirellula anaerolimosa]
MWDPTFSNTDRERFADSRLGKLLREEAVRDRPTFSPSLHARIMEAVENDPPEEKRELRRLRSHEAGGGLHLPAVTWGMVAATLLIGLAVWWLAVEYRKPGEIPAPTTGERHVAQDSAPSQPDIAASPPDVLETASSLPDIAIRQLQSTLVQVQDRKWAYLDRDAVAAKRLVESQFPTGLAAADMP